MKRIGILGITLMLVAGCGEDFIGGFRGSITGEETQCMADGQHWYDSRLDPAECKLIPQNSQQCHSEGGAWEHSSNCCIIVNFPPICAG